ncbi:MAG: hypothetical protein NTY02_04795 [Acidobacteria bacterium]|nr:hypothetical protein [Acidobacteriota bacterium]
MKLLKGQKGLSLVEVTIMLLVLMLLTGVLAPSIFDYFKDAQWVKVKEDCEAIGISVARLTRDVGPCLKLVSATGCTMDNRVEILYSDGNAVVPADVTGADFTSTNMPPANLNWDNYKDANVGDSMERQFVTNAPSYPTPSINYPVPMFPVGPLFGLGWRGAYLAAPIGPDPWGKPYMVNSGFLAVASDAVTAGNGNKNRWWENDVYCISPGPNSIYETNFGGNAAFGVDRVGDDFIFVIQGSGR